MDTILKTEESSNPADIGGAFDNLDIEWTEDGEMQISERAKDPEVNQKLEGTEKPAVPEAGASEKPPEVSPEMKALQEKIAGLEAQIAAGSKKETKEDTPATEVRSINDLLGPDEEFMDVFADKQKGVAFLEKALAQELDKQIAPLLDALQPIIVEHRVSAEVREMNKLYGEDFRNRIFLIEKLSHQRPDLSLKAAYNLVKEIPIPAKETPAKTGQVEAVGESTKTDSKPAVSPADEAQALKDLAVKLTTEKGVGGNREVKVDPKNIKQALDAAVEELSNQ